MPPWSDLAGATSGHDSAGSQAAEDLWPAPTDPTSVAGRLLDEYRPQDGLTLRHWCSGWMRWTGIVIVILLWLVVLMIWTSGPHGG